MKITAKCPFCGTMTKMEIDTFDGIEIVLCDDLECENLFAVSWKSKVDIETLRMAQPEYT